MRKVQCEWTSLKLVSLRVEEESSDADAAIVGQGITLERPLETSKRRCSDG